MLALSPDVVVRQEAQGALLFHRGSARTILIDRAGLALLAASYAGPAGPVSVDLQEVITLERQGFLVHTTGWGDRPLALLWSCLAERAEEIPNSLLAPESLHIALTDACDQACPGCFYSRKPGRRGRFLSRALYSKILDEAARVKVLQFAFGGGEPLLHPRLADFVRMAHERGIVPNVTTNGNRLTRALAVQLKRAGLGQVQISLDSADPGLNAATRPNFREAAAAVETCRRTGLRFGINALVTRDNFRDLPRLLDFARRAGARGVNLLRPKPPALTRGWLGRMSLTPGDGRALHRRLMRERAGRGIGLTLDQSWSFLAFDRRPDELFRRGVWGCGAGRRFLSIDPAGAVYPCSHYRKRIAREGDFMSAWTSSPLLNRFRRLETTIEGACRSCRLVPVCRGCRAVVKALGGGFADPDPHCPTAGRAGRSAD